MVGCCGSRLTAGLLSFWHLLCACNAHRTTSKSSPVCAFFAFLGTFALPITIWNMPRMTSCLSFRYSVAFVLINNAHQKLLSFSTQYEHRTCNPHRFRIEDWTKHRYQRNEMLQMECIFFRLIRGGKKMKCIFMFWEEYEEMALYEYFQPSQLSLPYASDHIVGTKAKWISSSTEFIIRQFLLSIPRHFAFRK